MKKPEARSQEPEGRGWAVAVVAALIGCVSLGACNAPRVEREQEIERFKAEIAGRTEGLALKPGAALSMDECERLAIKNSLSLGVARLRYRIQDDEVRLALAGGLPKVNLGYTNTIRSNESAIRQEGFVFSGEDRHQQAMGINATMPILDFGTTYYAWQIAKDRRKQEALVIKRAEQQLRRDVRVAYARHAGALRQLRLAVINVKAGEEVLRVAEALEKEGITTRADTSVIRATLAQAKVEQANAEQRIAETRLGLAQLLSLPPKTPIVVDPALPVLPKPPTVEEMVRHENHALSVRPELLAQDLERHKSANDVRKEVAQLFPKLDAVGSFNWTSNAMLVNPTWFVGGFQVAQSLLEGGARIWRIDRAKVTRDMEKERTLLLSLGVLYEVDLRAIQLHRSRDTIDALAAQEGARRQAFDQILSLYKEGLETEAGTAKALAELSLQTLSVDAAQTEYLVTWYEFLAAALPEEAEATTMPATQPQEKHGAESRPNAVNHRATENTEDAQRTGFEIWNHWNLRFGN